MIVVFSEVRPSLELDEMPSSAPLPQLFVVIGPFSGTTNCGKKARKKIVIFGFVMQRVNPRRNCFAAVSDFVLSPSNLFFDAVNAFHARNIRYAAPAYFRPVKAY